MQRPAHDDLFVSPILPVMNLKLRAISGNTTTAAMMRFWIYSTTGATSNITRLALMSSGFMISDLQIVYPYYDNPQMLEEQVCHWLSWSDEQRSRVKIILVDDGSENHPAEGVVIPDCIDYELYRINTNIPWNQNGAHNLGFHIAADGWCVSTDIDHILVANQLDILLNAFEVNENAYYTFARRQVRDMGNTAFKRHPNSWLLTKETYWKSGGYDEDFSGYYGSDSVFRRGLDLVANRTELDSPYLVVYDELDLPDANTRQFSRKGGEYHSVNYPHLLQKRRTYQRPTEPLRFPWERVR